MAAADAINREAPESLPLGLIWPIIARFHTCGARHQLQRIGPSP
jgi:hypothetical protein